MDAVRAPPAAVVVRVADAPRAVAAVARAGRRAVGRPVADPARVRAAPDPAGVARVPAPARAGRPRGLGVAALAVAGPAQDRVPDAAVPGSAAVAPLDRVRRGTAVDRRVARAVEVPVRGALVRPVVVLVPPVTGGDGLATTDGTIDVTIDVTTGGAATTTGHAAARIAVGGTPRAVVTTGRGVAPATIGLATIARRPVGRATSEGATTVDRATETAIAPNGGTRREAAARCRRARAGRWCGARTAR